MRRGSQNIRLSLFTFLSKNFLHTCRLSTTTLYYIFIFLINVLYLKTEILAKYKSYKNHKIDIKL